MSNRAPYKNTCPDIDEAIGIMEHLRKVNDGLRTWGEEQADEAERLAEELEKAKERIDELESTVEELKAELQQLQIA